MIAEDYEDPHDLVHLLDESNLSLVNRIDFELLLSLEPHEFRAILPNLLVGLAFEIASDDLPIIYTSFKSLIDHVEFDNWDDKFLKRWGYFEKEHYDLIDFCIDRRAIALGQNDLRRARKTLDQLRILAN